MRDCFDCLPIQQDGVSFLDLEGPNIGLVVLVHLLPSQFPPLKSRESRKSHRVTEVKSQDVQPLASRLPTQSRQSADGQTQVDLWNLLSLCSIQT